jgi:hypothetical protein
MLPHQPTVHGTVIQVRLRICAEAVDRTVVEDVLWLGPLYELYMKITQLLRTKCIGQSEKGLCPLKQDKCYLLDSVYRESM